MKQKLKNILFHQSTAIRFNKECLDLLVQDEKNRITLLEGHRGYGLLIVMSKQYLISNLFKLMHHKEDNSIPAIMRHIEQSDYPSIVELFNKAKTIYKQQNIQEIRNQHVAHLDMNREKRVVSWLEIQELNQILSKLVLTYHEEVLKQKVVWNLPDTTLLDLREALVLKAKSEKHKTESNNN